MTYLFQLAGGGELAIREAGSGRLVWQGMPDRRRVASIASDAAAAASVVLLELDVRIKSDRNLICVDPSGAVRWRAELPDAAGADAYVAAEMAEGRLIASSWSGHRVTIDPETGAILSVTFVK